jgi:hypothetical protein
MFASHPSARLTTQNGIQHNNNSRMSHSFPGRRLEAGMKSTNCTFQTPNQVGTKLFVRAAKPRDRRAVIPGIAKIPALGYNMSIDCHVLQKKQWFPM